MTSTTTTPNTCAASDCKSISNALCLHCNTCVCTKHYLEHVKLTNDDLMHLSDQLNSIVNKLHQCNITHLAQHATEQLEQWREEGYSMIDKLYDEKKTSLETIIQLKLKEDTSVGKQLCETVRKLTDQGDASHHQVEQLKKPLKAFNDRCTTLEKSNFFHINTKPFEINTHSITIKAKYFGFFTGGGSLLRLENQIQLNKWVGNHEQKWRLVYKGKRDGFKAEDFHRCSDNQGPTLTIIQSKEGGWLFGGYTSQNWSSVIDYVEDQTAPFIFTLTNPHNISPTKYIIRPTGVSHAVVHSSAYGPTFGGGFDLHVCDESQSTKGSYSKFPTSYDDTTGKGELTFTGSSHFETSDIEVYRGYGPTFAGEHDCFVCNNSHTMACSILHFPHSYKDTTCQGRGIFTGNGQFQTSDIEIYRLASFLLWNSFVCD
ncbi:unnamed protein product [Rotaria magnacalcarata]|uniref:TLDc domain-containing protein n=1 Tax=Rotaria magnacalcarata TaxID=392030 RepID=A0A815YSZ7_9BILA|nr:unnamed protein product [Rotaria magnacalcarata]CAF4003464.1 unnamed protein product [Rotaria magnacalcarata]